MNKLAEEISNGSYKSLAQVGAFLVSRIKEVLSTPAPMRAVVGKTGNVVYRAVTPATVGRPPRLLSGKLRSSITSEVIDMAGKKVVAINSNARGVSSAKYPQGFPYPQYHETKDPVKPGSGQHPFVLPTVQKWIRNVASIIGQSIKQELGQR